MQKFGIDTHDYCLDIMHGWTDQLLDGTCVSHARARSHTHTLL